MDARYLKSLLKGKTDEEKRLFIKGIVEKEKLEEMRYRVLLSYKEQRSGTFNRAPAV